MQIQGMKRLEGITCEIGEDAPKAATWSDGARNTADSDVTPLSNKSKCGTVRGKGSRGPTDTITHADR